MACPTTGYQVPTKSIAVPDIQEANGLDRFATWWHCKRCQGWHLLGLFPAANDEVPKNGLSPLKLAETYGTGSQG
jgi:hypothetical protein